MKNMTPRNPLPNALLGLLLSASSVCAQAPSAATEAIRLNPFEVTEKSVNGYAASETMTGSRVATPIIDLPYSVNVLTNEFTTDFGLFEFAEIGRAHV